MIVADPAVEVSPIDTFQGGIWNLELVGAYAKPDMVSVKAMASAQHI